MLLVDDQGVLAPLVVILPPHSPLRFFQGHSLVNLSIYECFDISLILAFLRYLLEAIVNIVLCLTCIFPIQVTHYLYDTISEFGFILHKVKDSLPGFVKSEGFNCCHGHEVGDCS